ncbi:hypothetical protein BgAZ_500940 [Babesia gibsoni]|uniref:EIF2B subunit epsilon/gamma LbH domain-containing protein n=1 Tax=Babesia gibsoni TaxID=33632 RepID=A0AAD8LP31_BABGI|nr:hypothetical protein BgAZ_500940 [Babesia gibsoni]
MEVFMLVGDDVLAFEPLASAVNINELYIGGNSIFNETLENLWQSGLIHMTLVVEKSKASQFERYHRRFKFGRRDGHIDVDILPLNVSSMVTGNVLREIYSLGDELDDFILLFWNTLLTVPLYDAIELHKKRRKEIPRYSMSALYIEDATRKFSNAGDDFIILHNASCEILAYQTGTDRLRLNGDCLQKLKQCSAVAVRYDLCKAGIYICSRVVAEHYTNWFDNLRLEDYIMDCLTREFKTEEVYLTVLHPDIMFPTFPPSVRIKTPKQYHTVYMEYITRFQENRPLSQKPISNYKPEFGPIVRMDATFMNNSAFVPPLPKSKYLFESVSNSIVGKNLTLGKNSTVYRCIIFDDVVIGKNCSLTDSIIMNGVEIANDTIVPPGSIICSGATISPKTVAGTKRSLRVSTDKSRYIDLTKDSATEGNEVDHCYIWPISEFGDMENTYIGDSFYDLIKLKAPSSVPEESESISEAEERCDSGSAGSCSDEEEEEPAGRDGSDEVKAVTYSREQMGYEVIDELSALTIDCLENPALLPNKALEIKSLKISYNLQKADMIKVAFDYGLSWIISRARDEDELRQIIIKTNFKEFLEAFEYQIVEENHYSGILKVCEDLNKSMDYFSQVCEALYSTDIMDFEGLQAWLTKNNVSGTRINTFAQWIAED